MLARLHRVKQEHKVELLSFPLLIFLHDGQVQLFLFEVQPLDQRPEKQPYFLASLKHKHPGGRQPQTVLVLVQSLHYVHVDSIHFKPLQNIQIVQLSICWRLSSASFVRLDCGQLKRLRLIWNEPEFRYQVGIVYLLVVVSQLGLQGKSCQLDSNFEVARNLSGHHILFELQEKLIPRQLFLQQVGFRRIKLYTKMKRKRRTDFHLFVNF